MPYVNGYLAKLVKDPVIKTTNSGKTMATFTIVNEEGWGNRKRSDFYNCVAWEKTANIIVRFFKKGDNIFVEGDWQNNPFRKNEKGYDEQNFQLIVRQIHFLPKPKVKVEEEEYVPDNAVLNMSAVNGSADDSSLDDYAPLIGDEGDLPFDFGLAYP